MRCSNRRCASSTLHRADLGKAKSRTLTFGKVGFRQSTRLTLPRGVEKVKTIIEELLRRGMKECVVYPEPKIDKDALKKYSAGEIAEVGAKLEVEDVFGYDVDEEALGQQ